MKIKDPLIFAFGMGITYTFLFGTAFGLLSLYYNPELDVDFWNTIVELFPIGAFSAFVVTMLEQT